MTPGRKTGTAPVRTLIAKWMQQVYESAVTAELSLRPWEFTVNELVERMTESGIELPTRTAMQRACEAMVSDNTMVIVGETSNGHGGKPQKVYALKDVAELEELERANSNVEKTSEAPTNNVMEIAADPDESHAAISIGGDGDIGDDGNSVVVGDGISVVSPRRNADDDIPDVVHVMIVPTNDETTNAEEVRTNGKLSRSQRRANTNQPKRKSITDTRLTNAAAHGMLGGRIVLTDQEKIEAINGFAKMFSRFTDAITGWENREVDILQELRSYAMDTESHRLSHNSMTDGIDAILAHQIKTAEYVQHVPLMLELLKRIVSGMDRLNDVGITFNAAMPTPNSNLAPDAIEKAYERGVEMGIEIGWKLHDKHSRG